jgi:hypothetical protein
MNRSQTSGLRLSPRMGFVVDVVGYGWRTWHAQAWVEARLAALVGSIVADLGVDRDDVWVDGKSGDSVFVVFPADTDPTVTLPSLLVTVANRLMHENAPSGDPMRMRMAVGFGLVGHGKWGISGPLVVDLSRLNDCEPIRRAAAENPRSDLVVLVSNTLYSYMIRSDSHSYLGTFRGVEVVRKEFAEPAWLWLASSPWVRVG